MQIKPLELNMETIMFGCTMIGFLYRIIRMEAKIESSIESVDKKLELHIEESHGVRTMLEYKIAGLSERMKEIIICLNANGK